MEIREILGKVRAGEMSVEDAIIQMRLEPFEDLGYARVDHHRALRQGVAKVTVVDGRVENCLLLELLTDQGIGTEIAG